MRILFLSDDFPPQSLGGADRVAFNLAQNLRKAGHQVFVITTTQNKSLVQETAADGLRIFRIYANFHERWMAYLGIYNPQTVGVVRKLISEIKPDVVHAHNVHCYLSYHCLKIAKKASRALFLTAHDAMLFYYGKMATPRYLAKMDYRTSWRDHLKQAKKRYNPFRNILIRHYLKYVDKIFACTRSLQQALDENKIKNAVVIYNGVDVNDWRVSPELVEDFKNKYHLQDKKIIFFGGRLSYLKGGEQAIKTIIKIKTEVPEAVLLVVGGKHAFTQQMKALVQSQQITENIVFTDWLRGDGLKAAYHSADVVLVPSIYFDTVPMILVEAMACKKSVIGSYLAGSAEVVQDGVTGYVVNPFDIEAMAGKIIELLKNPAKARQFGEAGYERIKKHFSLDAQVAQTLAWYQKTL